MQAIRELPMTKLPGANQAAAQGAVEAYLMAGLGAAYKASAGSFRQDRWDFLIRCQRADLQQPCIVGRVAFDAQTGVVIALTPDQIREIRECTEWEAARVRGELARTADGYVSRHQARRLVRRWLDQHLAMKFGASDGLFIFLNPPLWQFSIHFHLQDLHLAPLGVIDVDAQTGAVKPLADDQLDNLRERVRAVIQPRAQTPTP